MIRHIISLILFVLQGQALAVGLQDYTPYQYEVLFTNPTCKEYLYDQPILSNDGEELLGKPQGAYCKSSDGRNTEWRENSPHKRLVDWIRDPETKEIFMAYLSFSKSSITDELCKAIKERNLKVTLIIDAQNKSEPSRTAQARELEDCRPGEDFEKPNNPVLLYSGHEGGIGYAHNKLFFVNPSNYSKVRLAFSSGNMSSGTVTHHENWHFVTTSGISYFAEVHRCLIEGMTNHDSSKKDFSSFIKTCRAEIKAQEEENIKVFFVPGEGSAATKTLAQAIKKADSVDMAAHRFSYGKLINMLKEELETTTIKMRLVVDDDVYWSSVYHRGMGRNSLYELGKVNELRRAGLDVRYVQTYADSVFEPRNLQLQHNKFLIFDFGSGNGAVFAGAGNLTGTAFSSNFENFYYITIPEVYEAFKNQYQHMWNDLATPYENMPTELVLP